MCYLKNSFKTNVYLRVVVLDDIAYSSKGHTIGARMIGADIVEGAGRFRVPIGGCEIYGNCTVQVGPEIKQYHTSINTTYVFNCLS